MKKLFLSLCLVILSLPFWAQTPGETIKVWGAYDFKHSTWNTVITTKISDLEYLPYIGTLQFHAIIGWNADNGRPKGGGAVVKEFTFPKSNVTFYIGGWAGYEVESKLTGGLIGGVSIVVK